MSERPLSKAQLRALEKAEDYCASFLPFEIAETTATCDSLVDKGLLWFGVEVHPDYIISNAGLALLATLRAAEREAFQAGSKSVFDSLGQQMGRSDIYWAKSAARKSARRKG